MPKPALLSSLDILKDRLKRGNFRGFFQQLSFSLKSDLFGRNCPLCDCKTDMKNSESKSYLPFKICSGCSIDLSMMDFGNLMPIQLTKLKALNLDLETIRHIETESNDLITLEIPEKKNT